MSNTLWNRIQQATKGKKYLHVPKDQQNAMQSDRSYLRIFIAETPSSSASTPTDMASRR